MARKLEPEGLYPSSPEAEGKVLGGLLAYPHLLSDVLGILTGGVEDFYSEQHRAIFRAIMALASDAHIDVVMVITYMRGKGQIDDSSDGPYSAAYIQLLEKEAPPPPWVLDYAGGVRDCAQRRQDMQFAEQLHNAAQHESESYERIRATYLDALALTSPGATLDMQLLTASEAEALPPPQGIVGNMIFEEDVAYLYAPSGRWKTFVALDWSLCVAAEKPWMGRPVRGGDVLYICSEGARGIGKRITAWKMRHGVREVGRLFILAASIDLTQPAQMSKLAQLLEASDVHPALIVIDTLAASNSGDENAAQNASIITMAARRIIRAHPGVCILIVHHTGYDNTHMRGSSALYANADTVIRIEGGDANRRIEPGEPIKLISDKPKNGEPFADIVLTADLQTWAAEDGSIHSSLVMIPGDEAAAAAKAKAKETKLTPNRRRVLTVLEEAGDKGATRPQLVERSGLGSSTTYNVVDWLVSNGYARHQMEGLECVYYCLSVPSIPMPSIPFQSHG